MKVSKEIALELIKTVRATAKAEEVDTPNQKLSVYFLDDITLSFTVGEKTDFYGLTFEALGRDFSIINNLEVLVTAENDEGDEEGYIVEDETLIRLLNEFLAWRTRVLTDFGA